MEHVYVVHVQHDINYCADEYPRDRNDSYDKFLSFRTADAAVDWCKNFLKRPDIVDGLASITNPTLELSDLPRDKHNICVGSANFGDVGRHETFALWLSIYKTPLR